MQNTNHSHKQAVAAALHNADKYASGGDTEINVGSPEEFMKGIASGQKLAGGGIAGRSPYRLHSGGKFHSMGLFNAPTGGRTDVLHSIVPVGAYVMPADVVSGLGEGNTQAGANIIHKMMSTAPYGGTLPKGGKGMGIPKAPGKFKPAKFADGGEAEHVPIIAAGGEFLIHPEQIKAKFGDLNKGHKALDHFVITQRKKLIKTLKKLPGPKNAKK